MIITENETSRNSRNFGSKHSLTLSLADDNDNGVIVMCVSRIRKSFCNTVEKKTQVQTIFYRITVNY